MLLGEADEKSLLQVHGMGGKTVEAVLPVIRQRHTQWATMQVAVEGIQRALDRSAGKRVKVRGLESLASYFYIEGDEENPPTNN